MKKMLPACDYLKSRAEVHIVLPSLKLSGGTAEAVKLADDIETTGPLVTIITMWQSPRELPHERPRLSSLSNWTTRAHLALFQLPILMRRFWSLLQFRDLQRCDWIFTHYATLPLALLVPREHRWFFVQGLEWKFLESKIFTKLLRLLIIWAYRRSNLLAANPFLAKELEAEGLFVREVAPIWADPIYSDSQEINRDVDVLMVLRKGACKRLDLYLQAIDWFGVKAPELRICVITTEDEIGECVSGKVAECHIRLGSPHAMLSIYRRSKLLLHLSEHEGFALPPLEAMGSGCVPICRNSGGPEVYMTSPLDILLFALDQPLDSLCRKSLEVLADSNLLKKMSDVARQNFKSGKDLAQQRPSILAPIFANDRSSPNSALPHDAK